MYESDASRFIREVLAKNPQIEEQRAKNRATWWDRPQDLENNRERDAAAVPQPGYVYFPLPRPEKDDDPDSGKRLSTPDRSP